MDDPLPESDLTVGEIFALSPTRTYAPIIKKLLTQYRSHIKGMVHCSEADKPNAYAFGTDVHFVKRLSVANTANL